ncbi:hypothetical protein ACLOJK_037500, partial [Asimina triloba]
TRPLVGCETYGGEGAVPVLAAHHRGPSGRHTDGRVLQGATKWPLRLPHLAVGRYKVVSEQIMAPKRNMNKGKALMVEEEPKGPRIQSRSLTLIIREQEERAREAKNRATWMGSSSDMYEEGDELLYGQMPVGGQARTEEIRMEGTAGLHFERGEPSSREATPQVAASRGNEDKISAMIDIMADMMYQLRDVLARQNRVE